MNEMINKIKSSINNKESPKNLKIFEFTKIINPEYVTVGDNVIIDDYCLLYAKKDAPIRIGDHTHIASFASITGGPATIGRFVGIASGSRLLCGSENFRGGALMTASVPDAFRQVDRRGIIIGDYCVVGANSVIFPGVEIGEGAIVGSLAVVKKSLEPWGVFIMRNGKIIKISTRDKGDTIKQERGFLDYWKNKKKE